MYLGFGIVAVAIAYLLYGFLLRIFSKKAFYTYENIGEKIKEFDKIMETSEIKSLFIVVWHNAWRDGLIAIANYCANQASTLIASFFLTLAETAMYSIGVQLVTAITTIAAGLYTAYQPSMQRAHINNNKYESRKLMSIAMVSYDFIFVLGLILLLTVGFPILKLIRPTIIFSRSVIIGIAIYNFFYKRQSYYASYISNTNRVPYMKSYLISGAAGILCAVFLVSVFDFGVWGLILGQLFPQIIYNCWKWPREVYKILETNFFSMFKLGLEQLVYIFKSYYKKMKKG